MKQLKKFLYMLVLWMLIASSAQAEIALLPQLDSWQLEKQPLSVTLTANVSAWVPLDDTRTGWLNDLVKHLTLKLGYQQLEGETWSTVDVLVDDTTALSLSQRAGSEESQLQLSVMKGKNYVASADADIAGLLLGDSTSVSFAGIDSTELTWLTDAYDLACGLDVALQEYGTEKSVSTSIANIGTAKKKMVYTVPAEAADSLPALLGGLCVEGKLQTLVKGLTFSGKQEFAAFYSADGTLMKVSYAGSCGVDADHLRKVTINWSMKRGDDEVRDNFTMKSPAVSGRDRNTITFTRVTKAKKNNTVAMESTLKHVSRLDGVENTLTVEADLSAAPQDDKTVLTGTVNIKNVPEESSEKTQLILIPALTISAADATDHYISGTVTVTRKAGENLKRVERNAEITLSVDRGDYFDWKLNDTTVNLSALSETELESVQTEALSAISTALIRPLVLLPEEDTQYLSADLDEAVWQSIVDAAKSAMEEEAAQ